MKIWSLLTHMYVIDIVVHELERKWDVRNGDEEAWKLGLIVGRRIESQGLSPQGNQKAVGLRDKPARSQWRFAKVACQ